MKKRKTPGNNQEISQHSFISDEPVFNKRKIHNLIYQNNMLYIQYKNEEIEMSFEKIETKINEYSTQAERIRFLLLIEEIIIKSRHALLNEIENKIEQEFADSIYTKYLIKFPTFPFSQIIIPPAFQNVFGKSNYMLFEIKNKVKQQINEEIETIINFINNRIKLCKYTSDKGIIEDASQIKQLTSENDCEPYIWLKSEECLVELIHLLIFNKLIDRKMYNINEKSKINMNVEHLMSKFRSNSGSLNIKNIREAFHDKFGYINETQCNDTSAAFIWLKSKTALIDLYYQLVTHSFIANTGVVDDKSIIRTNPKYWVQIASYFVLLQDKKMISINYLKISQSFYQMKFNDNDIRSKEKDVIDAIIAELKHCQ